MTIARSWSSQALLLCLLLLMDVSFCLPSSVDGSSLFRPPIPYDCEPCLDRTDATLVAFLPESPTFSTTTSSTGSNTEASQQMAYAMEEVARSMNVQLQVEIFPEESLMVQAILDLAQEHSRQQASSTGSSGKRISALMISIPTPTIYQAVIQALEITDQKLPILGLHMGHQYFDISPSPPTSSLLNFVGMDELQSGKATGNRIKSQYWKKDTNTTVRRVLYVIPSWADANNNSLSHQIQQRLQGLKTSFAAHVSNVTLDTIVVSSISDTTIDSCSYDAIVLADKSLLSSAIPTLTNDNCQQVLSTFGTNTQVYNAISSSQIEFTIGSDYYLMASLTATLAGLYATTGTTLLPPTGTNKKYYTVAPRILHVNNLQQDAIRACEAIGFPSCQNTENDDVVLNAGCVCHDRSVIRIAAVYQNNPVFQLPIAAARQAGRDLGITLLLDPLDLRGTREEKDFAYAEKIRALCQDHVDGIITTIRDESIAEAVAFCQSLNIPVVALTPVIPAAKDILTGTIPVMGLDDFHAGYTMGQVLLERGVRYGVCMNWKNAVQLQPLCDAFELAMIEGGGTYLGVIHGKADNRILNRDIIEQFIQPKLNDTTRSTSGTTNNMTRWEHVGIFMQGSNFVSGATFAQESHPGLVLGVIERDEVVYEALRQGKLVATLDQQHYLRGYLPVALLTWLRQTRQQLSTQFLPTGPIVVRDAPGPGETICREQFFPVCPEYQEKNHLGRGIRGVGYCIYAFILVVAGGLMYWVHVNRDERIVKASQPEFLIAICFGCVVLASAIIPMSLDDGVLEEDGGCVGCTCAGCDVACMSSPWLYAMGFVIIFASLFSKIWRMNRLISGAAHFRRLKLSARDVIVPLVVLLSLNLIFLVVWTAVDPMYWERGRRCGADEFTSYGVCRIGKTKVSVVMGLLVILVDSLALFMANYQAYKARNFSTEYSESKYIALAMMCILQVLMVGVPLSFLVTDSPPAWFLIRVFIAAIVTLSVLLLMFIPKIQKLREATEKKRQSLKRREEAAQNAYLQGVPGEDIERVSNGSVRSVSSSMSSSSQRSGLKIRKRMVSLARLSWQPEELVAAGLARFGRKQENSTTKSPTVDETLRAYQSGATGDTHRVASSITIDGIGSQHNRSNPHLLGDINESDDDVVKSDSDGDDDNDDKAEEEDYRDEGEGLRLSVSNRAMVPLADNDDTAGGDRDGLRVSVTKDAAPDMFLAQDVDNEQPTVPHQTQEDSSQGSKRPLARDGGMDGLDDGHVPRETAPLVVDTGNTIEESSDDHRPHSSSDVVMIVDESKDVSTLIDTGTGGVSILDGTPATNGEHGVKDDVDTDDDEN
ncbi:Gamma-aminobutyric acid (GABA) B receptor [Seminavis robusta]|uniref:Gamma-aminobutyric acid (GABA) B receptor n=1 Tax=Seminavis robusta TaxID=568900 RepID=A0A9N8F0F0_9STRA|nr:Gamma-aminobutyric acid (GABA) B receptor [Seminavis robusta]|eukprot:Sro2144_g316300.1 Gamma-aminobutyric acid (GABA) B receptor (1333) ;mRNA; r:5490-9671